MNIALFTDTYPPFINGVSTSCYNLAQVLRKNGHRVIVVTPRASSGKMEFIDDVIYMPGIEIKKLYGYRLTKFFDNKVLKMLKEFNIDLIHNQTDVTIGMFARRAAKILNVPIVYTYHTSYEDYTYYATKGMMDRVAKKVVRAYSRSIGRNATEFITPSQKTKDFMRNVGHDIYVNVIPSGIDLSIFKRTEEEKERIDAFKKEHGIEKDTKVFLLLGRVAKEKSMDVSIRNFAAYLQKHPEANVKMLIVGDGPARGELELLTHELNIASKVIFIGFVPASEVPFYYHLADIYSSASVTETQGLTFNEAMAAGTIILARYDDNLTNVITDSRTGFFFTDESSFIEKLERIFALSDKERQAIIDEAYRVVNEYSIDKFYENIMVVYERALKKYW